MNSLEANTRSTKSKGDVRSLRLKGNVPGIIYGGANQNEKVSVSKKTLKFLIDKENFLLSASINLKPILCLLFSLSGVGFPKPTNKSIFFLNRV